MSKPNPVPKKHAGGRPSLFSAAVATEIIEKLCQGIPLTRICEAEHLPSCMTVFSWLRDERYAEFLKDYTRAREVQADKLAEDILAIADDGSNDTYVDDKGNVRTDHDVVHRSRLRMDARKWLASHIFPKKYGDRQQVELTTVDDPTGDVDVSGDE